MPSTTSAATKATRAASTALGAAGIASLGLALGAILVGQLILVPLVAGNTALVDANLARALAEPLTLRAAELTIGATVILAALAQPWLRHRVASSLALLAAGIAACDRLVLLPELHGRWGRVDLVAMRPLDRIAEASQLSLVHHAALAVVLLLLLALSVIAALPAQRRR